MIDVVVCTKNRPKLVAKLINQIKLLSYNRLVIIDGSDTPFKFETPTKQIIYIHTPNLKLGHARQIGLKECGSKYVFFVDDDLDLTSSCLPILYNTLDNSDDASLVAVSGRVIHGKSGVSHKLFSQTRTLGQEGEKGGFVLLKREEILSIGGFNKDIHWGDDVELHQRMNANGMKWYTVPEAIVYHPWNFLEALYNMIKHGGGCRVAVSFNGDFLKMATRLVGRVFVMPIVYGFQTYDPRVFGCYFIMNLFLLLGFCGFSGEK